MKNKFWKDLRIDSKIGKGNFGIVYKVIQNDGKVFAVKHVRLPREYQEVEKIVQKGIINNPNEANGYFDFIIKREVEIMKILSQNPYILSYYDFFIENNDSKNEIDYYIKMEYACDITKYFNNKKIDVSEIIKLAIEICHSLEFCAANNIIHKDIKPQNIFFGTDGIYKLGDFNVSVRVDGDISHYGTLNYMSPEIHYSKQLTMSSDIYSLGIVMYKLITGEIPFKTEQNDEKDAFELRMSGTQIPVIEGLDDRLMGIILKACSFDVEERYKTPFEMRQDLEALPYIEFTGNLLNFSNSGFERTIGIYEQLLPEENTRNNKISIIKKVGNVLSQKKVRRVLNISLILIIMVFAIGGFALNRTCKDGYINKNGMCVKGYYYCEKDYVLNDDNKCQKTIHSSDAKVTYTCKTGYTLSGETCVSEDVKEAKFVYKCADGFTLNGTKCEKTESIDAAVTYNCPSDYVPSGKQCVKVNNIYATTKYYCEDSSYTLSSNICVKEVEQITSAKAEYSCAVNETKNGNKCTYSVAPTYNGWMPTCSCGTYSRTENKCINCTKDAKLSYSCSQGSYDNLGNCKYKKKITQTALIKYTCPSGYEVVGNQCAKTTGVAPTVSYVCGGGAQLKDKKCYTTITSDAVGMYDCENGYVPSGTSCYKNDFPNAIKKYRCSRIYTLNGDKCEKYKIVDAKVKYE